MFEGSNIHKSPEGWRRFQERTGSGQVARRADMSRAVQKPSKKIVATTGAAVNESHQPRMRNRRRYVIGD